MTTLDLKAIETRCVGMADLWPKPYYDRAKPIIEIDVPALIARVRELEAQLALAQTVADGAMTSTIRLLNGMSTP